jgi:hypothetical protein
MLMQLKMDKQGLAQDLAVVEKMFIQEKMRTLQQIKILSNNRSLWN